MRLISLGPCFHTENGSPLHAMQKQRLVRGHDRHQSEDSSMVRGCCTRMGRERVDPMGRCVSLLPGLRPGQPSQQFLYGLGQVICSPLPLQCNKMEQIPSLQDAKLSEITREGHCVTSDQFIALKYLGVKKKNQGVGPLCSRIGQV